MDRDELDRLAANVLSTLDGASAALLRTFAAGLALAGRPVSSFATPIRYLAEDVEYGAPADRLTRLAMRHVLRRAALEGSLISTLATAETPFWRAVGDALALVAADLHPAG